MDETNITCKRIYDMYSVITHSNLQEFIKEVNKFTKIGWKLYGDMVVDAKRDRYYQAVTLKSNEIAWEDD